MSQALYRKWRPSTWEEVVGQQHVIQTLRNAVSAERVGHAYLFAGPRGTGKTTAARILAKAVNCLNEDPSARPDDTCDHCTSVNSASFLDLIEIDAASNTSVEDVRDLRDKINFSPNQGRYKVYIIDEVHMLSTAAFNALLKTLEEPPPHAIFVLATTEVHKIPATVLSRCQRHEFRRIAVVDIVSHLEHIAKTEKIEVEPQALQLIARQAAGALRDAISLLDQLSASGEKIDLESAHTILGTAPSQSVLDIIDSLINKDGAAGLSQIHTTLDAGSDPRQFTRQIVSYLRNLMLVRMGNADQVDAPDEVREKMAEHAQKIEQAELLRVIRTFNDAVVQSRGSWQPSLPLELAFVEALENPAAPINNPSSSAALEVEQVKKTPETKKDNPSKPPAAKSKPNDNLGNKWSEILAIVKEGGHTTISVLNACRTRELRSGVLYLGFTTELMKDKMKQEEHFGLLTKAAEQVLGDTVQVKCVVTTNAQGDLPPEVDNSGMVATAMRLGGEIVDMNDLSSQSKE